MDNLKYYWHKLKYNLSSLMHKLLAGRYGIDHFYRFLTSVIYFLLIIQIFFRPKYLYLFTTILLFYNMYRVFSKNHQARHKENQIYLKYQRKFKSWINLQKRKFEERKEYRFKVCPNCKQNLRIKNIKGKHTVSCPKCKKDFDVKI
ncbi:MAG TPA: hypothetical protein PLT36_05715 [Erysipelotrichaceae bacterium]|nr:hypothetical protein [Erysipelotrichia bacterium]HPX32983.1 hypothetical protein [Erysipelotrichaceae bacterium]HQA85561.1 hypothetical protein [Erysipelotrichaceae bacterium]